MAYAKGYNNANYLSLFLAKCTGRGCLTGSYQCANVLAKGSFDDQVTVPYGFSTEAPANDMRLALRLAESISQSTPIANAANELYKVAKSYGLSDEDFSAVTEALKAAKSKKAS